jgi:hypothetical protein
MKYRDLFCIIPLDSCIISFLFSKSTRPVAFRTNHTNHQHFLFFRPPFFFSACSDSLTALTLFDSLGGEEKILLLINKQEPDRKIVLLYARAY